MEKMSAIPLLLAAALLIPAHARADEIRVTSLVFPPFQPDNALQEENLSAADLAEIEAGKTIVRSRPMPAGVRGTHFMAAAWVRGSVDEIFDVVVDCKGQPAFVPHLESCANTYAPAVSATAVVTYEQTEKLKFGFGFISKEVRYTNYVFQIRPYVRGYKLKRGDLKTCEGYFRVIPYKNGRQILVFDTLVDPGSVLPEWIQEILTQSDLPNTVEAYKQRVEKLSAAAAIP